MSYIDQLNIDNVFVCPECGCEEFEYNRPSRCANCELFIHVAASRKGGGFGSDVRGSGVRFIYGSRGRELKSIDEWDWKMAFSEADVTEWVTWSNHKREDSRTLEEVRKIISDKWEAQKVMFALTKNKNQGG